MKRSIIILSILLLGVYVTNNAYSADANGQFKGQSGKLLSVSVTPESTPIQNVQNQFTDQLAGSFTIDNNNKSGFKITLTSTNAGKLILAGGSASNQYENIDYTVKIQSADSNLGAGTSDPITGLSLATAKVINYTSSIAKPSKSAKLNLLFSSSANKDLWEGEFSDTITVTIADPA